MPSYLDRLLQAWCLLLCLFTSSALHLHGSWYPHTGYLFLTKFGFQRTQIDELEATRGYIYGTVHIESENVSAITPRAMGTLVLVDSEFILDLYGNGTELVWLHNIAQQDKKQAEWAIENERCRRMFSMIDRIAWHRTCAPTGRMDLLRTIPCPVNGVCDEEDNINGVVGPSQFTYTVQDLRQPRYWYLSLVACARNVTTCEWETTAVPHPAAAASSSSIEPRLTYDIWLVNGAPHLQGFNKFEHQFSFEAHDTVEMYMVFFTLYLALAAYVHIKLPDYRRIIGCLFLIYVWLCTIGCLLTTIHLSVFSSDGRGVGFLSGTGVLITQWGDAIFLILLLVTAHMGFVPENTTLSHGCFRPKAKLTCFYERLVGQSDEDSATNHPRECDELPSFDDPRPDGKPCTFLVALSALFLTTKTVLYLWASFDQNPVVDLSLWHTVPGCLLLAVRFCVAFWFLAIIRKRQLECGTDPRAEFDYLGPGVDLVHFAAGYLLWMLVLPLVVFVAETSISSLWRSKTIMSVCFSADYVAACAYAYHLSRSRAYSRSNESVL